MLRLRPSLCSRMVCVVQVSDELPICGRSVGSNKYTMESHTFSVLVARGRAQIGVHSAKTDWTRRILDFQYMDYDDQAAHIA